MKKFIWIFVLILTGNVIQAQVDSIFDAYIKEFEEYHKAAEREFNTFKEQNDSAFLKFLEESWQEFELFLDARPVRPKPQEQPVIKERQDTTPQKIGNIPPQEPVLEQNEQINDHSLKESEPVNYQSRTVTKSFDVFGIKAEVQYNPDKLPHFNSVNEESIAAFYRDLSKNSYLWNYNISELGKIRQSCHFNDWGYYLILTKAAENIFDQKNERILLVWYMLVKSGYMVKIGYDNSDLFLLLPARQKIYNVQYLSENGLEYYLFQGGRNQSVQLKTYPGFYTDDAKIFSFTLNELPKLNNGRIVYRQLIYNQKKINLAFSSGRMEFLNSYPQCALNVYFKAPVSSANINVLDNLFVPLFKDKTNLEKTSILLNFIQESVAYKTDQEQFGKERYMFAEECLYYPFSDCEDRSVLLGQLVKHYTGLPVIGLEFKNHVTLAVYFRDELHGNYVLYKGKKYFICDPTYINAKIGMVPKDLKSEKPKVIVF